MPPPPKTAATAAPVSSAVTNSVTANNAPVSTAATATVFTAVNTNVLPRCLPLALAWPLITMHSLPLPQPPCHAACLWLWHGH